jgi:hypothetical protein
LPRRLGEAACFENRDEHAVAIKALHAALPDLKFTLPGQRSRAIADLESMKC